MATLSEEFVFEYFSQLNPIAHKIQAEINQTIENYEHYWNNLDKREQMTIINEAVIKPEIQLNYHRATKGDASTTSGESRYRDIDASLLNYFRPKSDTDRPFSYKTRSQQNLFYSLAQGNSNAEEAVSSAVRLPVAKPKTHQMNKSTDSLTCVNLVNLNMQKAAKKGRAPAIPTKMTTKPPPPPPPTTKPSKVVAEVPVVVTSVPVVKAHAPPPPVPTEAPEVIQDIAKIPEDSNSNTSLLSPAEEDVEQQPQEHKTQEVIESRSVEPSDNDDEFKSLLDSDGLMDFLNNW